MFNELKIRYTLKIYVAEKKRNRQIFLFKKYTVSIRATFYQTGKNIFSLIERTI